MHKIYSNSDNHHVKATIVYANEDEKLYFDPEFTTPVLHKKGELRELFHNGMVIVTENYEYRPIKFACIAGYVKSDTDNKFYAADVDIPE